MGAKDDHLLPRLHVRVRVARIRVESPFEHRARDVHGTGNETLPPTLVARAQIDHHRSIAKRLEGSRGVESRGDATSRFREELGRRSPQRLGLRAEVRSGNPNPARSCERGHDHDRRSRTGGIGDEPGKERADDEAEVAPEAVDADDLRALDRLNGV